MSVSNVSPANCFPISQHARLRLQERWPNTVLRPQTFHGVCVPHDATLVGWDPSSSAAYLEVPATPMVAVVGDAIVKTFLSRVTAREKLYLHGWWFGDVGNSNAA